MPDREGPHPKSEDEAGIRHPEAPATQQPERVYERYSGVCDVMSPEEARAMAEELRRCRKNPDRKIMIGTMAGHFTLHPDLDDPGGQRGVFPTREEMSAPFTDDPDVLNTVHFADLYRPREAQTILEDLELVVKYSGEHLHAIQLDVTWPNPEEIIEFSKRHPDLLIILQLGNFSFNEVNSDPQQLVERLREYGDAIDYVLLDLSMGKGKSMESEGLLPFLRQIRKDLPHLGLAVAGGLGPDTMNLLEPIAKEFPNISIDAQGRLKHAHAKRDAQGHMVSTEPVDPARANDYIRKSCEILDKPSE